MEFATSYGPANVELIEADEPTMFVALTHGAGGGIDAPDIVAIGTEALRQGATIARIIQPYLVAGTYPTQSEQAEAWIEIVNGLRASVNADGVPLILAGRSLGARLVCRTAVDLGARAVIADSYPGELSDLRAAIGRDVIAISGEFDGHPGPEDVTELHILPGEAHIFTDAVAGRVTEIVRPWLTKWKA